MRLPVNERAVLEIVRGETGVLTADDVVQKVDGSELRHKRRLALNALLEQGKVRSDAYGKIHFVVKPEKTEVKLDGHPRSLLVTTHPGRRTAAEQPCQALRAAFQCPYFELRQAALKVLRTAIAKGGSVAGTSRVLGVDTQALFRLKKDFPQEWNEACHESGAKLARMR